MKKNTFIFFLIEESCSFSIPSGDFSPDGMERVKQPPFFVGSDELPFGHFKFWVKNHPTVWKGFSTKVSQTAVKILLLKRSKRET